MKGLALFALVLLLTSACHDATVPEPTDTAIVRPEISSSRVLSITDLGTLGGDHSTAADINDRGQVVGFSRISSGAKRAFLWEGGVMKDLGTVGGVASAALGINNQGQIAGWADIPSPPTPQVDCITVRNSTDCIEHAFLWTQRGGMVDLGTFGGDHSNGLAINNPGRVVGWALLPPEPALGTFEVMHPFLWRKGTGMMDLGTLSSAGSPTLSKAADVNSRGQVVGWSHTGTGGALGEVHAFLWHHGIIEDLGTLSDEVSRPESRAFGINGRGQIVGRSIALVGFDFEGAPISEFHAVLWENGVIRDLGTLGGRQSIALDINDLGQVVGASRTGSGESHAFLWENGVMHDLGTLGGALSSGASAINNRSQVVGGSQGRATLWTVSPGKATGKG